MNPWLGYATDTVTSHCRHGCGARVRVRARVNPNPNPNPNPNLNPNPTPNEVLCALLLLLFAASWCYFAPLYFGFPMQPDEQACG